MDHLPFLHVHDPTSLLQAVIASERAQMKYTGLLRPYYGGFGKLFAWSEIATRFGTGVGGRVLNQRPRESAGSRD